MFCDLCPLLVDRWALLEEIIEDVVRDGEDVNTVELHIVVLNDSDLSVDCVEKLCELWLHELEVLFHCGLAEDTEKRVED